MRVVVIGDVSWKGNYHLGDEAMTEVAITELRRRGAEVTLIAGDTDISRDFYEVDTIHQFGFLALKERTEMNKLIDHVMSAARGEVKASERLAETLNTIASADAVLIAGGGNLNSNWARHIFERLALARVAKFHNVPLYVSSQTVGPELNDEDAAFMQEIVHYARMFGAREPQTAALMRELGGEDSRVVQTLDDAFLLEPADLDEEDRGRLELPKRYIVGSFTFHAWSTGLQRDDYYDELAQILDAIAIAHDVDVLLLAHMGSLQEDAPETTASDVYGHERIAQLSKSGRVRAFKMLPAREVLSITAGAQFTLSTRYHPVVFGVGVGVPAIGIVTSYYSAVRMRGALGNVGMEQFAIPLASWEPVLGERILSALDQQSKEITAHIAQARERGREFQSSWWDAIVADIGGDRGARFPDLPSPVQFLWADERTTELLSAVRIGQEGIDLQRVYKKEIELLSEQNIKLLKQQISGLSKQNTALTKQNSGLTKQISELAEQNNALDLEVADLRHKMRPIGANIRDNLRKRLRDWRDR